MKNTWNSWPSWDSKEENKLKSEKDLKSIDKWIKSTVSPRDGLHRSLLWLPTPWSHHQCPCSWAQSTFSSPPCSLAAGQAWGSTPAIAKGSRYGAEASSGSLADVLPAGGTRFQWLLRTQGPQTHSYKSSGTSVSLWNGKCKPFQRDRSAAREGHQTTLPQTFSGCLSLYISNRMCPASWHAERLTLYMALSAGQCKVLGIQGVYSSPWITILYSQISCL